MTSLMFPQCRGSECRESAVSFSDFCWAHTDKPAYLAALPRAVQAFGAAPSRLNFKKVECQDVDFVNLDLRGSSFSQAHLRNIHFVGSDLSGSDLIGAHLHGCDFVGSDLSAANMTRAVFERTSFSHSDLRSAIMTEAHFREADFMGARMHGVILWNADLSGARYLKKKNFAKPDPRAGEEAALSEKDPLAACESYRLLKHHFYSRGLYEDASWAAYRELTMERRHFFEKKDLRFIPSLLMDILCGYTEKPIRVTASSLAIILSFAAVYHIFRVPVHSVDGGLAGLWDCVYFSFITFTTVGYGDFTPKAVPLFRLITCAEAFSGPFMAGLYIFTLTRRYAAG